jgi:hypothetical protein
MTDRTRLAAPLLAAAMILPLAGLPVPTSRAASSAAPTIAALPGYTVTVFARGTAAYSNPDSIVSDGTHVYVGYQNVTAKDGSDHKSSTVVEYTLQGQVVRTFAALGHCDGLRIDPTTHLLWALSDEDGDPHLTTIDPVSGATQLYQFAKTPHGGGYDDMAFTHGVAFIDASNPTLDKNGNNVFPALDTATLSGGSVQLRPVLMGNASSLDITAGNNKKVTLNLIDPDSMTFDPAGALVLDNQAGMQLVFIANPGTARQSVRSLMIGDALDDTIWPSAPAGRFLISDTGANTIFALHSGSLAAGSVYGTAPSDSGVAGFVGTIDLKSGVVVPVAIGFKSPHGMLFLPGAM